ncbi:hypothetical protein HDE_02407 [Halotydeus destructor]|nr:hypothetical protein HDE_02407 [Halotydeus destructor]
MPPKLLALTAVTSFQFNYHHNRYQRQPHLTPSHPQQQYVLRRKLQQLSPVQTNYRYHETLEKLTSVVSKLRNDNQAKFQSSHRQGKKYLTAQANHGRRETTSNDTKSSSNLIKGDHFKRLTPRVEYAIIEDGQAKQQGSSRGQVKNRLHFVDNYTQASSLLRGGWTPMSVSYGNEAAEDVNSSRVTKIISDFPTERANNNGHYRGRRPKGTRSRGPVVDLRPSQADVRMTTEAPLYSKPSNKQLPASRINNDASQLEVTTESGNLKGKQEPEGDLNYRRNEDGYSLTTTSAPLSVRQPVNDDSSSDYDERQYDEDTPSGGYDQGDNLANLDNQSDEMVDTRVQIDVACLSKEEMTVVMTFAEPFDGLVYAKGFFSDISCHFVRPQSPFERFEFTLRANSCGTTFNDNGNGKKDQTSLDNVLIIQNHQRVQETGDIQRHVQCSWSGSLQRSVLASVIVDQLPGRSLSYSGDGVEAIMEIHIGEGPEAKLATNDLVQIGDILTAVISLTGIESPKYDLEVLDCIAHDGTGEKPLILSDDQGCIVRRSVMRQWIKRKNFNGSPLIAYSLMKAFKFPEKGEVFFECNVELCKGKCRDTCSDPTYELEENLAESRAETRRRPRRDVSTTQPVGLRHLTTKLHMA